MPQAPESSPDKRLRARLLRSAPVIEICRATSIKNPGFIQLLSQFLVQSGADLPDGAALDTMENAVRMDRIRYYMALEDGRVVGVVSLTMGFSTQHMKPYAVLSDLYVHPGHRGRGVAAKLLASSMDGAHEAGCFRMVTESHVGMEGIFDRAGWKDGERVMQYSIHLDEAPPSLTITGSITFD